MSTKLSIHCIATVSSQPATLTRRGSGAFYCHIEVPIGEQLVVYCEGDWEHGDAQLDVTLTYKDDEIILGKLSQNNKCLVWRRENVTMPVSMTAETEKGLAKIVVDMSEDSALSSDDMMSGDSSSLTINELKELNENTPQFFEDSKDKGTPNRPKKRRTSLNIDKQVSIEPTVKKQKPNTRTRTPKAEKENAKKSNKDSTPKPSKDSTPKPSKDSTPKPSKDSTPKLSKDSTSKPCKDSTLKSSNQEKKSKSSKAENLNDSALKTRTNSDTGNADTEDDRSIQGQGQKDNINKATKEQKEKPTELYPMFTRKCPKDDGKVAKETVTKSKKNLKPWNAETNASPKPQNKPNDLPKSKKKGASASEVEDKVKMETEKATEGIQSNKSLKSNTTKDGSKDNKKSSGKKNSDVLKEAEENQSKRRARRGRQADQQDASSTGVKDNTLDNKNKDDVSLQSLPVVSVKEKMLTGPQVPVKGKTAMCKDVTLRALDRPTARWGHSFCFVHKNMSVLIGGQGEKQQLCKDSVWTLDLETRQWKDPETWSECQKPEYRMGHTATYDDIVRCIYVFGGSKNTRWFHDVHILDIDEWKWHLVKVNGKAPTRAYHSATLYRHELWVFGGVYPRPDPQPDGCSNEIHIFSPVMESWYSPIVSGEKPIPRSGHSATLLDHQLVVFGGWDAPISYSDLHILDMSIVEWSQPELTGTPPSPRSWHASCGLSNKRVLIHGGYNGDIALDDTHIFDLGEMSWSQIRMDHRISARAGHKCMCMPYRHDNDEEDEVIIFGGGDNDGAYFDDLHSVFVPFNTGLD